MRRLALLTGIATALSLVVPFWRGIATLRQTPMPNSFLLRIPFAAMGLVVVLVTADLPAVFSGLAGAWANAAKMDWREEVAVFGYIMGTLVDLLLIALLLMLARDPREEAGEVVPTGFTFWQGRWARFSCRF